LNEFKFDAPFLSLAANAGLLVGAIFWGHMGTTVRTSLFLRRAIAEVIPDSWSFNITLLLAGVFGLSAGGSPNFVTLASLLAVMGVGVGGLPTHIPSKLH